MAPVPVSGVRTKRLLHIFDLDGTLAEKWAAKLLPGVPQLVGRLDGEIAVATNQAGVAWYARRGEPYPAPSDVGERLVRLSEDLPRLRNALWLVAIGDQRLSLPAGRWRGLAAAVTRSASGLWVRTSSDPEWRKPRPGMVREAVGTFGVPSDSVLFVGDRDDDAEAAAAAGVRFAWAEDFFGRA